MTAMNVWIKPKAGYIVSDAATYDLADGKVLEMTAKVIPLPSLRMAIGVQGMASIVRLGEELEGYPHRTQADIRAAIPKALRTLWQQNAERFPSLEPSKWAIGITAVYWSRRSRKPEVSVIGTDSKFSPDGLDPWRLYTGSKSLLSPDLDDGGGFSRLDPETGAVGILERQRATVTIEALDGSHFPIVGGLAQLVKITATGVEQRILRTWPDKIGERIAI